MSEKNKALVRRYLEAISNGDMAVVDELVHPNHTCDFGGMKTSNRKEYKQTLAAFAQAFPDMTADIEDQIAEGDKEVHRWVARGTHTGDFMGVPPTGNSVEFTVIFMSKIVDGKIVEEWGLLDNMTIMQQIGAIPMPE